MKKREGYKIIIPDKQRKRIKENKCPTCGLSKDKWTRRKDWRCCSKKCSDIFYKDFYSAGWPDLRRKAFVRDNYACVKCGKQFIKEIRLDNDIYSYKERTWEDFINIVYLEVFETFFEIGIAGNASSLIGDHIKPIALGGDEWDLDNIQTLCIPCDKIKTAQDMKDIAIQRRKEKKLA